MAKDEWMCITLDDLYDEMKLWDWNTVHHTDGQERRKPLHATKWEFDQCGLKGEKTSLGKFAVKIKVFYPTKTFICCSAPNFSKYFECGTFDLVNW